MENFILLVKDCNSPPTTLQVSAKLAQGTVTELWSPLTKGEVLGSLPVSGGVDLINHLI